MGSAPVRSRYHERPDYRVARLAGYVAFDQDEVRVTIGKGCYTGVRP